MKITDFIGEATEYDKKEMLEERKPRSWLKSVSAFANGIGGALIIGVSNDETLVGLRDVQEVSEKISETIKTKIYRDYMEIGSEVHIDIFDDRMEIYSPGGMFDGSIVQNLDTDNVASKRRNPVIADIFSRMHFMERRGSGFKKIKADYHRAVNYRSQVEPLFRSTPTSFFVTLYNLNYNVPIEKVLIDPDKIAVDRENVLIAPKKLSIQNTIDGLNANKNTKEKAHILFAQMGDDGIFGRNDIMEITNISITAAGNLLTNLKRAGLVEAVRGYGKGKYKSSEPKE